MEVCTSENLNLDLSENVTYNIPAFPVYMKKGQLSSYPDFRAVSHWHDDLEFILILEGQMSYEVNGQHFSLSAGEGLFVNSRCFHYGYSDTHTECMFICIVLSPTLLSANAYLVEHALDPLIRNMQYPYQKLTPAIGWQNAVLKELQSLYDTNMESIRPFAVICQFAQILELLSEHMHTSSEPVQKPDDILSLTAMIGFVQKHYPDKILLKDIAAAGNCCKTRCTALFQKYLSTSPMLYLNHYRLEKGSRLLCTTTLSITEIAYACGFSGASYFCEQFHRKYHVTPKEYRKRG